MFVFTENPTAFMIFICRACNTKTLQNFPSSLHKHLLAE